MYNSRSNNKSAWVLCLLILAGIVVGGFIGEYLGKFPYMEWLRYGKTFGLAQPLLLDLDLICIQFGLTIKFSIAGIIGMIISIFIYKKLQF